MIAALQLLPEVIYGREQLYEILAIVWEAAVRMWHCILKPSIGKLPPGRNTLEVLALMLELQAEIELLRIANEDNRRLRALMVALFRYGEACPFLAAASDLHWRSATLIKFSVCCILASALLVVLLTKGALGPRHEVVFCLGVFVGSSSLRLRQRFRIRPLSMISFGLALSY